MSEKHLAAGSELPPLKKDTLRLYSMRFCPFAQRTRLVLARKNIPHETVNVNLKRKPDWFFEKNPLGMVPILEINDQVLYESAITCEYLEETYPDPPLMPRDPYEKAYMKILMEHYSKVVPYYYKIRRGTEEELNGHIAELQKLITIHEKELAKRNTKYFGGDSPDMLDYYMWPWLERIPNMDVLLPKEKLPKLNDWTKAMREDAAVKAIEENIPTHATFISSYTKGEEPDFDIEPLPA